MRKGLRERETDGPPGEEKEREKNAGPAWGFRLKEAFFCKRFKQIQFEFKFEEFKFKLNHNIKTMQG